MSDGENANDIINHVIDDLISAVEKDELGWHSLHVGDQICAPRWGGIFYHHGVYAGNNKVLHFAGNPWNGIVHDAPCMVRIDSLSKFAGLTPFRNHHSKIQVVNRGSRNDGDSCDHQNFEKLVGSMKYNVLVNNCEHFASFVSTGHKKSMQTNKIVIATMLILSVLFPKAFLSTTVGVMLVKRVCDGQSIRH